MNSGQIDNFTSRVEKNVTKPEYFLTDDSNEAIGCTGFRKEMLENTRVASAPTVCAFYGAKNRDFGVFMKTEVSS